MEREITLYDLDKKIAILTKEVENQQITILELKNIVNKFVNSEMEKVAQHEVKISAIEKRLDRVPINVGMVVGLVNVVLIVIFRLWGK